MSRRENRKVEKRKKGSSGFYVLLPEVHKLPSLIFIVDYKWE
jgi:hypothetical protein